MSNRHLVLGVDMGMTGARAAIMDDRGRIVVSGARFAAPIRGTAGRAEQDPDEAAGAVAAAIRDVLAGLPGARIAAIGVAALGPAPVLVDDRLAPLAPALLFSLDTRAEPERRAICEQLGLRDDQLTHDHALPKLAWWRGHRPEIFARASGVLDMTGYLVGQLTGAATMDEITACDYALAGMPSPLPLPPAGDAYGVAGGLVSAWAARLGLPAGLPVTRGTYDTYADTAAVGAVGVGDACVIFGSTLIIAAVLAAPPVALHGLAATPHLGDGVVVGGWPATGGSALGWARRLLGAPGGFADELEAAAASLEPGAGGLVFLPYLAGERTPVHDPAARGVLVGLTADTRREHVYRAVIDGLALSVRDHAERLGQLGCRPPVWRAGGGGSANAALVQATADATRTRYEVIADAGAPIGPCRLALRAIGEAPPFAIERVVEPDAAAADRFDRLFGVYRSLYAPLAGRMHDLAEFVEETGGNT